MMQKGNEHTIIKCCCKVEKELQYMQELDKPENMSHYFGVGIWNEGAMLTAMIQSEATSCGTQWMKK